MSYGNKPNEIRHPQAALIVNEYVCQRIQSLGYSADLNSEEVNQLTDANVVEVVDSDPSVSLTIDVNEFGSINIYNQLCGFENFPSSLSGAGDPPTGFTGLTVDNTNQVDGTISHTDFGEISTDFLVPIKEVSSGVTTRALWFSNCFIDSLSGTYQVDGFASESISMSGAAQQWFLNDWAGARIGTAIYQGVGNLESTHTNEADASIAYLTEDGIKLDSQYWEFTGTDLSSTNDFAFSTGSKYKYVYIPATAAFPTLSQDTGTLIGGVKEGEIEIIMWDAGLDIEPLVGTLGAVSTKALRVQSVDYEISFDREDLKQLYTGTYYKGLNEINVSATLTVLDSDLELWALTTGNQSDWTQNTLNTLTLADFQAMSDLGVRIDVFNTKDYLLHAPGTLLKSITLLGGKVTSVNDSRDVPGRGTQTFEIEFTGAHLAGTGLVGR